MMTKSSALFLPQVFDVSFINNLEMMLTKKIVWKWVLFLKKKKKIRVYGIT